MADKTRLVHNQRPAESRNPEGWTKLCIVVNNHPHEVMVETGLAQFLMDENSDPHLRDEIAQQVVKQGLKTLSAVTATATAETATATAVTATETAVTATATATSTPTVSSTGTASCTTSIKVWTTSEEEALINLRHERDDMFLSRKSHSSLWGEIAENLGVSTLQAQYKYQALKKKWKEIIDSKTGTETRPFSHRMAFDLHYGMLASTKPQATSEAGASASLEAEACASGEAKAGASRVAEAGVSSRDEEGKKGKGKRPRSTIMDVLTKQHDDTKKH